MEQRNRRLVEDPVCTTEYVIQKTGISDAPLHEIEMRIIKQLLDIFLLSRKEIVDYRHVVPVVDQVFRDM